MESGHCSVYLIGMSIGAGILPEPWRQRGTVMTGGLVGVGFGEGSDLALVVTHNGRGLIDCLRGERVARDPMVIYPDAETLHVEGIGALAGVTIAIAGIEGGELCRRTGDNWVLDGEITNSSDDMIRLVPPTATAHSSRPAIFTNFVPEVRTFGFSPTGRSFVIATGAEVFVFAR